MQLDSNNECSCPVDTYQNTEDGTIQCVDCPQDSSTGTQTGAQSIDECGERNNKKNFFVLIKVVKVTEYFFLFYYMSIVFYLNTHHLFLPQYEIIILKE